VGSGISTETLLENKLQIAFSVHEAMLNQNLSDSLVEEENIFRKKKGLSESFNI